MLCLLALIALLVFWAVNSGGSDPGEGAGGPKGSHSPVATITAGPTPTGTHISGRPGGRGSSGGSGGGSSDGASAGSGDPADGGSPGATQGGDTAGTGDSAGTAAGDTAGAGTAGGSAGTAGSGGQLPVGSTLPDCAPGAVQLSLRTVQNSYSPDETPAFELRAANSGAVTCKVDFGPAKAVFTVTGAADSSHTWASDDCPAAGHGSYLLQVPARSSTTFTLHWNGRTSSPQCAKPKGAQAAPGTYLVAAQLRGYPAKQVSFVLSAD